MKISAKHVCLSEDLKYDTGFTEPGRKFGLPRSLQPPCSAFCPLSNLSFPLPITQFTSAPLMYVSSENRLILPRGIGIHGSFHKEGHQFPQLLAGQPLRSWVTVSREATSGTPPTQSFYHKAPFTIGK